MFDEFKKTGESVFVPLGANFDRTIGKVFSKAGKPKDVGIVADGFTKMNTLNSAGDFNIEGFFRHSKNYISNLKMVDNYRFFSRETKMAVPTTRQTMLMAAMMARLVRGG